MNQQENSEYYKKVKQIVIDFLKTQIIVFSKKWEENLIKKVLTQKSDFPEQQVGAIHNELLKKLEQHGNDFLKWKFPRYSKFETGSIVRTAYERWKDNFNADKNKHPDNPELDFLRMLILHANSEYYNEVGPEMIELPETDYFTGEKMRNKKGNIVTKKIKRQVSIDFIEKIEKDENDEEATYPDELLPDDNIENAFNKPKQTELGNFSSEFYEDIPITQEEVENKNALLLDIGEDNSETKKDTLNKINPYLKQTIKKYGVSSGKILKQYYILSGRLNKFGYTEIENSPIFNIKPIYHPTSSFLFDDHKDWGSKKSDWRINNFFINRWYYLKSADERQWMELAIRELKNCKEHYEKHFVKDRPLVSAVAVDKNGKLINTCYRGQNQKEKFEKHCEYSLFKDILNDNDRARLDGGSLYVTLEPCNKRKKVEKIPCSIRCLKSGINKIYIGTIDTNKKVEKKGVEILNSGEYVFNLQNSKYIGNEDEVKEYDALENIFKKDRNYNLINNSPEKRTYKISTGIHVEYFHIDLIEGICRINGEFLSNHRPETFYNIHPK